MSLQERIETLTERLAPIPPMMQTIVITNYGDPFPPEAPMLPGWYRIGPYYRATFLGGTEAERKAMVKQLRRDPAYQGDPITGNRERAIPAGEASAIEGT